MSDPKIIVAGWFTVDPAQRDAIVASFNDVVVRARRAPGCLDLAISADAMDSTRINNFEFWRSESGLNAWRAVANAPRIEHPMRRVEVQEHVIHTSGPPFDG